MSSPMSRYQEVTLAAFLGQHFEDGRVHVRSRDDRRLMKLAVRLGLVSPEGYLTASGLRFRQSHQVPLSEPPAPAQDPLRRLPSA